MPNEAFSSAENADIRFVSGTFNNSDCFQKLKKITK